MACLEISLTKRSTQTSMPNCGFVSSGEMDMLIKSKSLTTTELLHNPHPGEILMEEFLAPMQLSQTALARAIGLPPRRINEIVLGRRAITAIQTCGWHATSKCRMDFFLGLQTDYELMQRRRLIGKELKAIRPRAA
jgi:addiction module HigA family antidote